MGKHKDIVAQIASALDLLLDDQIPRAIPVHVDTELVAKGLIDAIKLKRITVIDDDGNHLHAYTTPLRFTMIETSRETG